MNDFTIKVNTGSLIDADTENKISQSAKYVANLLSRYIDWKGVLDIEIQVKPASQSPYPNANGILPALAQLDWIDSSWTNSTLQECLTGIDIDSNRSDAGCTIYLSSDGTIRNYGMPVWFDLTPAFDVKPNIPEGSFDFIGGLTHEIFHCLGFYGGTSQWQSFIFQEGNQFYFNGPTVKNLLGADLPLDTVVNSHYGNTNLIGNIVPRGLMFQWGNYDLNRLDIGRIDLAVLQDLGYKIKTYEGLPLFEMSDSDPNLTGTDGNEILFGNYQSNIINGLKGNDTLVGGSGDDTLDGGAGIDYAKYIDSSVDCIISRTKNSCAVTTKTEGIDIIQNIEFFQFSDKIIDLSLIALTNNKPTGAVAVIGSIIQGSKLTLSNTIKDADGLGNFTFQWLANGLDISGATGISLVLEQAQVGKAISVCVSYIDGIGNTESVYSVPTINALNVNDTPTGSVTIKGLSTWGTTLSVTSAIKDSDGLGKLSYSWQNDKSTLSTYTSYTLAETDVGKKVWVTVSYNDKKGNFEKVKSNVVDVSVSTKPSAVNDLLIGTDGSDKLNGLAGNDTLIGGLGKDTLTGGVGADVFKFTSVNDSSALSKQADKITDFKHAQGDKIDLSAIDANLVLTGNKAFTYIGIAEFSSDATGQLRFDAKTSTIFDAKTSTLYGSTNADDTPEFAIVLNGVKSLVAADFIL